MTIRNLKLTELGSFRCEIDGQPSECNFPLFIIRFAWNRGLDVEDLADGFGAGCGTMDDWSAIRDSSPAAIEAMLERALNFIFK